MAWHTNDATPPDTPIWSVGLLMNTGATEREREKEELVGVEGGVKRQA